MAGIGIGIGIGNPDFPGIGIGIGIEDLDFQVLVLVLVLNFRIYTVLSDQHSNHGQSNHKIALNAIYRCVTGQIML